MENLQIDFNSCFCPSFSIYSLHLQAAKAAVSRINKYTEKIVAGTLLQIFFDSLNLLRKIEATIRGVGALVQ